jgi:ankyrin repeat protein
VRLLLDNGADVQAVDARGLTPLFYAIEAHRLDATRLLLQSGARVNQRVGDATPLLLAAYVGDPAVVELLLRHGADIRVADRDGNNVLHKVISFPAGSPAREPMTAVRRDCLALLLDHGADVQQKGLLGDTPLHDAAGQGYADAIELLLDHGADVNARSYGGGTPLHEAAQQGRLDAAATLLDRGADVNARSEYNTPLSLAVRFFHKDVVALLLLHGADARTVDHRGMALLDEIIDVQGPWTPERREIAEMVLAAGADINRGEGAGGTPLHEAVRRGQKGAVEFLLDHGANINARDQNGQTPLHHAVNHKQIDLVELLIARGADVNPRDTQGRTPMYSAWGGGVSERIEELLRRHGGVGAFGEPDTQRSTRGGG